MTARATYQVFIDWDNDSGLFVGNFQMSQDGWGAVGTVPPVLDLSAAVAHLNDQSLKITWPSFTPATASDDGTGIKFGTAGRGFDQGRFGGGADIDAIPPIVSKKFGNLVIDREYVFSAWVYVPATGGEHVSIGVDGIAQSPVSTLTDEWQQISVTLTAINTEHLLTITPNGVTVDGDITYVDDMLWVGAGEDVSARTLGVRTPLSLSYGRDQARALAAIAPGETTIQLDNRSRDYSPDNPGSVIAGFLSSGKRMMIRCTYQGHTNVMFSGYLDDYVITPDKNERSVTLSCLDALSRLNTKISTEVYQGFRTGDAVNKILDAIGWPAAARDIDPGGTVIPYWWSEGQTALEALNDVCQSEGPPCFGYVDLSDNFVFRDRHHRLLRPRSIEVQAVIVDEGAEPNFSAPMTYDAGWKDIVNAVDVSISEYQAAAEYSNIFESEDIIPLVAGQSRTISVQGNAAFMDAQVPLAGTDYILHYGTATVEISRTSGASLDVKVTSLTDCAISALKVRARLIEAARTFRVLREDGNSIAVNGLVSYDKELPWTTVNDAYAVANSILSQRSERLPIVTMDINNANETRLGQILNRQLSDRIRIVEDETFTNHDFYVERISHNVADIGASHKMTLASERVRTQVSHPFTFDDAAAGFNDGVFAYDSLDDPSTVFVLGVSALDEGLLGT